MKLVPASIYRSIVALPVVVTILAGCSWLMAAESASDDNIRRPHILLAIADDWGWPHAGAYGAPVVQSPTFDRIAREGVLFQHAYVSSPSCTPSRAALLTGQWHWRLEESANLWSTLQTKFPVYPDLLETCGYYVGYSGKGWGPGRVDPGGRTRNPAGPEFKDFGEFLAKRPAGQPFCFWFGSRDPHRDYELGSGRASGMNLADIRLPACFPDNIEVRSDVADYYFEVQRFDRQVAELLQRLDQAGELDRTIVIMTGDHNMPFPRGKGNLYDTGTRVPLAIRWPGQIKPRRTVDDFVSLTDLAPTLLEIAGVAPPDAMTGRSLVKILTAEGSGQIDPARDHVLTGKERHVACQEAPDSGGTPMRAIRTSEYLYIHNFRPDRWPAGTPLFEKAYVKGSWYGDIDNGPTKSYMVENQDKDAHHRQLFQLAFAKRPAEELYDLKKDPRQLNNVADDPAYAAPKQQLAQRLMAELKASQDPRVVGGGDCFDQYPYYGGSPRKPGFASAHDARTPRVASRKKEHHGEVESTEKEKFADVIVPDVKDDRLKIELFAAEPDIVTPTGIAVDRQGRVLVIENHTHFRPEGYQGPPADRIRMFQDMDGDGRADRITNFYEGTRDTMGLAVYRDDSMLVATRSEIFRLRDADGDGKADQRTPLVRLDTAGNYPHNGLCGFTFDFDGRVFFGLGENLGADYKLIGSDGTTLTGGGEGGSIYRCAPDGTQLVRMATGFWNPFHLCFDGHGRLFAVDNDPDWRPPCRLLHIVEGGDYGYRFRNGRRGVHPFTAWNGELPGTLPMVTGTGEAPSGIVACEAERFPADYAGDLLVTSWGDHRIERYRLLPHGASFRAQMTPVVQGGENFRPVGIAVAPDGSVYFSDWVDRSYELHRKGRVWRLSAKQPAARPAPAGAPHGEPSVDLRAWKLGADSNPELDLAALASEGQPPPIRAAALRRMTADRYLPVLLENLESRDPFIRHAASVGLEQTNWITPDLEFRSLENPDQRLGVALLLRKLYPQRAAAQVPMLLADSDARLRFLAVQWIGEEGLSKYRQQVEVILTEPASTRQLFEACLAALERLDGTRREATDEWPGEEYVLRILTDENTPLASRRLALRVLRPDHPQLTIELLKRLLASEDSELRREVIRSLRSSGHEQRSEVLRSIAADPHLPLDERAEAIVGLTPEVPQNRAVLLNLACEDSKLLAHEALRSLRGTRLEPDEAQQIESQRAARDVLWNELAARLLDPHTAEQTGTATQVDTWLEMLEGPADAAAGQRIFYHPRLAGCYRCHEVDGRGSSFGPDLTDCGQVLTRRRLVEAIVEPSREIAPRFVPWSILTHDGKSSVGMYLGQDNEGFQHYVDAEGHAFQIKIDQILARAPHEQSIMPSGLMKTITLQELRDLLAFLTQRPPLRGPAP